jgi:hypothetical protein
MEEQERSTLYVANKKHDVPSAAPDRHKSPLSRTTAGVLTSGSAPLVAMMKTANLRDRNHGSQCRRVHGTRFRRVLGQREMDPGFVIQLLNSTPIILNRGFRCENRFGKNEDELGRNGVRTLGCETE